MKAFFLNRSWWMDAGKALLEFVLLFTPSILIAYGIYWHALEEAKPYTPPPGYVFPRLPILEGEFSVDHKHGGRHSVPNYAGNVYISCQPPSYFSKSIFYFPLGETDDCIYRHTELYQKKFKLSE